MEPVGFAVGIAGLAGVFTSCIECFERYQFGRHFGEDFESYLIRLEVAHLRLTRWGDSMGLGAEPLDQKAQSKLMLYPPSEITTATMLLGGIMQAFGKAERSAERFKGKAKEEELVIFDTEDLKPGFKSLRDKFSNMSRSRQKKASVATITRWALYDREACISLISNIKGDISDLVELFPDITQGRQRQLCKTEVAEIDSESLVVLMEVAGDDDDLLKEVAAETIEKRSDGHEISNIKLDGFSRTHWGDNVGRNQQGKSHIIKGIVARGNAVAHFGNTYSGFEGRTIFDQGPDKKETHSGNG